MSDAAIQIVVSGIITLVPMVIGFLTLWVKLKYGQDKIEKKVDEKAEKIEKKVDDNTALTKEGTAAATHSANAAKAAAVNAAEKADDVAEENRKKFEILQKIDHQTNGGLSETIRSAIKPWTDILQDHIVQDDQNMKEIRAELVEIHKKVGK